MKRLRLGLFVAIAFLQVGVVLRSLLLAEPASWWHVVGVLFLGWNVRDMLHEYEVRRLEERHCKKLDWEKELSVKKSAALDQWHDMYDSLVRSDRFREKVRQACQFALLDLSADELDRLSRLRRKTESGSRSGRPS